MRQSARSSAPTLPWADTLPPTCAPDSCAPTFPTSGTPSCSDPDERTIRVHEGRNWPPTRARRGGHRGRRRMFLHLVTEQKLRECPRSARSVSRRGKRPCIAPICRRVRKRLLVPMDARAREQHGGGADDEGWEAGGCSLHQVRRQSLLRFVRLDEPRRLRARHRAARHMRR